MQGAIGFGDARADTGGVGLTFSALAIVPHQSPGDSDYAAEMILNKNGRGSGLQFKIALKVHRVTVNSCHYSFFLSVVF